MAWTPEKELSALELGDLFVSIPLNYADNDGEAEKQEENSMEGGGEEGKHLETTCGDHDHPGENSKEDKKNDEMAGGGEDQQDTEGVEDVEEEESELESMKTVVDRQEEHCAASKDGEPRKEATDDDHDRDGEDSKNDEKTGEMEAGGEYPEYGDGVENGAEKDGEFESMMPIFGDLVEHCTTSKDGEPRKEATDDDHDRDGEDSKNGEKTGEMEAGGEYPEYGDGVENGAEKDGEFESMMPIFGDLVEHCTTSKDGEPRKEATDDDHDRDGEDSDIDEKTGEIEYFPPGSGVEDSGEDEGELECMAFIQNEQAQCTYISYEEEDGIYVDAILCDHSCHEVESYIDEDTGEIEAAAVDHDGGDGKDGEKDSEGGGENQQQDKSIATPELLLPALMALGEIDDIEDLYL